MKIWQLATEDIITQLMEIQCLPALSHDTEVIKNRKSRVLEKLSGTDFVKLVVFVNETSRYYINF